MFAAVGGMLAPAAIYAAFNRGDPIAMKRWAIPTATDIAFALGVLVLLGKRVPTFLKVWLLNVAAGLIWALACLNRLGVTRSDAYLLIGLLLASLPRGVGWKHLHATAMLCGIGFTMSLFIASLAFEQGGTEYPGLERLGILVGTLVSGLMGYVALRLTLGHEVEVT